MGRGQAARRGSTLVLYHALSTKELRALRAAFIADRQSARIKRNEKTIAFCEERLALINDVLKTRTRPRC